MAELNPALKNPNNNSRLGEDSLLRCSHLRVKCCIYYAGKRTWLSLPYAWRSIRAYRSLYHMHAIPKKCCQQGQPRMEAAVLFAASCVP